MKTTTHTAKDEVLAALLRNLKSLDHMEDWSLKHPLVEKYVTAMDEPHRAHHGWIHICEMLREVDSLPPAADTINHTLRLRAAILMHDIVCIPGKKYNEELSVEFASQFYSGKHLAHIKDLILATRHTFPFLPFYDDRDVMCDVDLITLGVDSNRFRQYRFNIAEEYRGYCTPEEFEAGTKIFFEKLHKQTQRGGFIYRTEYFRGMYESQARENIKAILACY